MVRKQEGETAGAHSDVSGLDKFSLDRSWVLSSLEHDQLVRAKKHHIARRHLKGAELAVLWALRVYVLFMMAVVVYQVWIAAH